MKSVMILGGGPLQIPAIKAAKEMGWRVLLADGCKNIPGFSMADHFVHVDLKDHIGMAAAAADYKARYGLDGVFTAGTDFSTTVAWVAEKLNLPGIPYETALNATDKSRMRKIFRDSGVPSPDFLALSRSDRRIDHLPFDFPAVVKPVDNMGARGIQKVNNMDGRNIFYSICF